MVPQIKINAFWGKQHVLLLAADEATYERSAAEKKAHEETCRRLVRWLTLNYLAVLKVGGVSDSNSSVVPTWCGPCKLTRPATLARSPRSTTSNARRACSPP